MVKQEITVGILGAGAFGTALAISFSRDARFDVTLFSCFEEHVSSMRQSLVNEFFPNFEIPRNVEIETTKALASRRFNYLLWTFPVAPTLEILAGIARNIDGSDVTICSKGLLKNAEFLYDAFERVLPHSRVGYLAGANFAHELAAGKTAAADIAARDISIAQDFANTLSIDALRLYPTDDVIGSQICGAVKNIIAIAAGVAQGLDLGQNAHAALITKGLSEMQELGVKLGSKAETFLGICGIGDLILTASSENSRNMSLGIHIAKQHTCDRGSQENGTCEGRDTVAQVVELARRNNVRLPICETVFGILFRKLPATAIIDVIR